MRRFILAASLVGIFALGCARQSAESVANSSAAIKDVAGVAYGDFVIGEPISHENLTIFPISSRTRKDTDRFITLDEGLAAGIVKIIETGADEEVAEGEMPNEEETDTTDGSASPAEDPLFGEPPPPPATPAPAQTAEETNEEREAQVGGTVAIDVPSTDENPFGGGVDGDVNTLMVLNSSGKPLYLMPGEVISGGNQDRTIGQEIVIESSDKPVPVDVFCVEHGRWGGRSVADTTSQLAAANRFHPNLSLVTSATQSVEELAEDAHKGKFVASVGHVSKDVRMAVQTQGQGQVWDEVGKANAKIGNESQSESFAENYTSGEFAEDFAPFMTLREPVENTRQVVGVAVAVNGKMLSVDVFESTPLFKKFWPKLLKSYALDAVAASEENEAKEKLATVTVADCIAFLKEMEKANVETQQLAGDQTIVKRDSSLGISFSYHDAQAIEEAAAAQAGGGLGGGVHIGILAK